MASTRPSRYPKSELPREGEVYAFVVSSNTFRGPEGPTRQVTILCPWCGEEHRHGAPLPTVGERDRHPGRRNPHCSVLKLARAQYVVVVPRYLWKTYSA